MSNDKDFEIDGLDECRVEVGFQAGSLWVEVSFSETDEDGDTYEASETFSADVDLTDEDYNEFSVQWDDAKVVDAFLPTGLTLSEVEDVVHESYALDEAKQFWWDCEEMERSVGCSDY